HLGFVFHGIVVELHLDAVGLIDHVIVRQNVAGLIDHHAGAERGSLALSEFRVPTAAAERIAAEETLNEIVHSAVAVALILVGRRRGQLATAIATARRPHGRGLLREVRGRDVDHGWFDLLRDLSEGVRKLYGVGDHEGRRTGRYLFLILSRFRAG